MAPQAPLADRHPSVKSLMRWLTPNPNLPGVQQHLASQIHTMALLVISEVGDGPELAAGLRKLLEAKDCFIRQSLDDTDPS